MIKASSLENRGNGSWRLTISDGYAPDSKKIRFQRTIRVDPMHMPAVQRREAEKQAALLEADFRHGSAPVIVPKAHYNHFKSIKKEPRFLK